MSGNRSCAPDLPFETLRKRADFLAASKALRRSAPAFLLQARKRRTNEQSGMIRVGYTCSKKVGNAVARNRSKRRLREIARAVLPLHGESGWDYVLVGRREATADRDFRQLRDDLFSALVKIHGRPPAP